jgi:PAS domain S-box-containing protein
MSIRTKLIILLLAFAGIPVLLFGTLVFTKARTELETVRIAQLNNIADLKKAKIETFFEERKADIRSAQHFLNIRRNLPLLAARSGNGARVAAMGELDGQLIPFQTANGYLDVMLTDRQGRIIYASNNAHRDDLGKLLPDRRIFEEGKKDIYFTDVLEGETPGAGFRMFAVAPVHGLNGEFIGEVVLEIDMGPIYMFIQDNTGLGTTGEALIVRRDGNEVLFLSPIAGFPGAALKKRVAFDEKAGVPAQMAARGETGSGLTADYGGAEVLAAWRHIPSLRWGLVTKIAATEAFAPVRQLQTIVVSLGLFMVLAGIAAAALISRAIARPVHELQRGAEAIAAGDLSHRVGTAAQDEIGRLSRAFDAMTDALERDIADRMQVEKKLRESAETSRAILNATAESVYLMDRSLTILAANETAARKFNKSVDEVTGAGLFDLITADVAKTRKEHFEEVLRSKKAHSFEDARSGMYFEHTIYPIQDALGEVARIVVYSRDITERKKAVEEIYGLNNRLQHNIRQLEESNRELEAFSYSVSHDLRSPLRSIAGFSQALLEDYQARLDDEGRDFLNRIVAATVRMGQLIDDLLKLSRIARMELKRERVDLSSLAATIVARIQESHPEREAKFVIARGLTASGDERLLTVVLENLFANAWKFSEKSPATVIEFGANRQGGNTEYFAKDSGAGFDMAYANKLFTPFQRLHRETEFSGTGIGLATVKRIINRHGGHVRIESEVGKGTTVYFTLG